MRLRAAVGALAERNFRLLFASSTISGLGDGISVVALVFAVLQVSDSAIALGLVLAARQIADAAIVLAAGVWADRLPRHLVLIAVAVVQGVAQAITGTLVLSGSATIPMLIGLQAVYGLAEGFYLPASTGLIPATISAPRLQQANALLGLSRNATRIVGPAIGGAIVAAGSPGSALLIDAASFALGALLLVPLRLPKRAEAVQGKSFFADLRQGWHEFRRQTWIWTTIVFFGIG
ncbi:MAG TPA: MFS transporter, partial [Gaiellaceae bacterium]|nr:MFS transporter [Gaiellaceae bacterium]